MVKTRAFPNMPSNNPYRLYRFSLAMANHELTKTAGPANEYAIISSYSQGEEEIIQQAMKNMGEPGIVISDEGSNEPKDTMTTSPVAKPKRNRYGI
jgi:hypothetical protein